MDDDRAAERNAEPIMNVVFRTDASFEIGTGHVVRCLTLARVLSEVGASCRFITRDLPGHMANRIKDAGFEVTLLEKPLGDAPSGPPAHAFWAGVDWKQDANETLDDLAEAPDWLVVDHYAFDSRWEQAATSPGTKLLVIDDLADREHVGDLLLDQNLVAGLEERYDGLLPVHCGRLLGPSYALLQSRYAELHPRTPPREGAVRRVLIYFGGVDAENLTGMAISALLSLGRADIALDVVINPSSPHAVAVRQQIETVPHATLHEGLPSLAPLMVTADLAVGAAGTTSWERCCLGLPALVVTLADNQRHIAEELDRRGLIEWLGHKGDVSEERLAEAIASVLDTDRSGEMSARCRTHVDGKGAERVCSLMMLRQSSTLRARTALLHDENFLRQLCTDDERIAHMIGSTDLDGQDIRDWFHARLRETENCSIHVVETQEGLPLGMAFFERSGDEWCIHHSMTSAVHSLGMKSRVLHAALCSVRDDVEGPMLFIPYDPIQENGMKQGSSGVSEGTSGRNSNELTVSICSGAGSWINDSVPALILEWIQEGYLVQWGHDAARMAPSDICFYLSYERIVNAEIRSRHGHNLVVHASDLPKGRGWSPASWLILEDANAIPVTLLEAVDQVDAGPIYLQEWIALDGTELVDDWRAGIAGSTISLARRFVDAYPSISSKAKEQVGTPTKYPRRRPEDSALSREKTLGEQFNLLRIVDNDKYPAYFIHKGKKFLIKVSSQ